MKLSRFALLSVGLILAAAPARADDAAKAIVEKAIKAQGGAEALEKFPVATITFKGTFHGMGQEIPMTGEITTQGADRLKMDMEVEAGGQKIRRSSTSSTGTRDGPRSATTLMELDKDQIAEAKEQAHAGWVATLAPLVATRSSRWPRPAR